MRGRAPELEREARNARELESAVGVERLMLEKLEYSPDFWRKRAEETRRLAELIEDNFTAETLLEIALRYDELVLYAEQQQRRSD